MYRQAIMNTYRTYKAEFLASVVAVVGTAMLSFSLIAAPVASAVSIGGPSDCDNNAIVRCGVHSSEAAVNAYNARAYVRGVYAEFGITQADMASLPSTAVVGRVTKSGDVYVDGKSNPVATNAMTGGQQNIPGSTRVDHQGAVFYERPPSVSFQQDSLPAFVSMNNGQFQFAIIASCGNAVSATPTQQPEQQAAIAPAKPVSKPKEQKPQPQKPAPVSTPAPTVSQSQSQEVNVNNNNTDNNTNVNNNTQITEQKVVAQTAKATPAPKETTTQTQPSANTTTVQPATQNVASTLPNTGPSGEIGVFLIAVGVGTLGYRRLLLSRIKI